MQTSSSNSTHRPEDLQESTPATPELLREPHALQRMMRFLRLTVRNKGIVISALVASCLLGALYYSTATRR